MAPTSPRTQINIKIVYLTKTPQKNMGEYHHPPQARIYQLSKTNKTNKTIEFMANHNQIPHVNIHDTFMVTNIEELSEYSNEHISEWVRASQILLFNSFQESIQIWTQITNQMKKEIVMMKHQRKLISHVEKRRNILSTETKLDVEKIRQLPDDIIHEIWSYVDIEVHNKYFLGKYFFPMNRSVFKLLLQRLNLKTLKTIYKKTAFCYHGLCMQKMIPPERYNNPPVNRRNKHDFIDEISHIMQEYYKMYSDPLVTLTKKPNGQFIGKLRIEIEQENPDAYYGMVYPLDFYEKKTLQLWKHLAIAFHVFLPNGFYEKIYEKQSNLMYLDTLLHPPNPITPPLLETETTEEVPSPDDSIGFILL